MNIKISADSTCDLSEDLVREFDIKVLPLYVVKDGDVYRDGVDITPEDVYAFTDKTGKLCSTQAMNIENYREFFKKAVKGCDALIHVNISADFSSCYQNAKIAAEEFDNVYVVDSRNLSTGHGHIVLAAAEMAKDGKTPDEIIKQLEYIALRVDASFILDRLDYMAKGGRCSSVLAFGANLLKIKPCIEVVDGKMTVGKKYRGPYRKCLEQYITERLDGRDDIDMHRIFITHSGTSDENVELAKKLLKERFNFENINVTHAGCTVSCHCGYNTVGILYICKNPKEIKKA